MQSKQSIMSVLVKIFNAKKILSFILFAGIPSLLFYCTALWGLWSEGYSIREILRDPAQLSGESSLLGFLSNIGIFLWVSSIAVSFFCALIMRKLSKSSDIELLVLIGALSFILAIDDFFMIHDRFINERIIYLMYAVFAIALLVRHFNKIIKIDGFAFMLAGLLLALSILTDILQYSIPLSYDFQQIIEEGFKFIGAATWLYFSCSVAAYIIFEEDR